MTLKECEKAIKRYERVLKQSDKQEKKILELYEKLEEKEKELREIYEYERDQQLIAKEKIEENLAVEVPEYLKTKIFFQSLDTLSGDIYSIYKLHDKKILYFIADGQGHGVSPAITVFNFVNIFKSTLDFLKHNQKIDEKALQNYLNEYIIKPITLSLIEGEQLSYTIVLLDLKNLKLSYAIGGMYPTYVETDDIIKVKANNLPMTKNTKELKVDCVDINNFKRLISYSDGVLEILIKDIMPKNLIKNPDLIETISNYEAEDDITVIYFEK